MQTCGSMSNFTDTVAAVFTQWPSMRNVTHGHSPITAMPVPVEITSRRPFQLTFGATSMPHQTTIFDHGNVDVNDVAFFRILTEYHDKPVIHRSTSTP
jgi:hypothetical protein